MEIFLIGLFYFLFVVCVIHPPAEVAAAGFTIPQLLDGCLGSENMDFVNYHFRRVTATLVIHSLLPVGFIASLWVGGARGTLIETAGLFSLALPLVMMSILSRWYYRTPKHHPVLRALMPYVTEGNNIKNVISSINSEFRSVEKVSIQLTVTSKFVATETWLVKVCPYMLCVTRQDDAALIATATDTHELTPAGDDEVQYVNIDVIPGRRNVPKFSFRVTTLTLRELQPRLAQPVVVPDHVTLQPSLVERFINVFKQHVESNPPFFVNDECELCIGCMQSRADVKLRRRCEPSVEGQGDQPQQQACGLCNCRIQWCCTCMARWWATRAEGPPSSWLQSRCTCPLCRATFCLLDVLPVRTRN